MMLGDLPSISLTDSYNYTRIYNQYRICWQFPTVATFSKDNQSEILSGIYPSSLYSQSSKDGIEFALGGQYTNDHTVFLALNIIFR
jgi:hypothetical protein